MKHIKKFENFSPVNEEFLGLDRLWDKAKGAVSAWADRRKKAAAEGLLQAIDSKKEDPEMQKALAGIKAEAARLSPEDKEVIASFAEGNIPEVPEGPEDAEVREVVESLKNRKLIKESIQMILEEEGLAAKIVKYLGLSTACLSLVSLIIVVIKIAIAGSGWPIWIGGLTLGTLGAILMGSTFIAGLIGGVGAAFEEEDDLKRRGNYRK
jgi:hypothetical protein